MESILTGLCSRFTTDSFKYMYQFKKKMFLKNGKTLKKHCQKKLAAKKIVCHNSSA